MDLAKSLGYAGDLQEPQVKQAIDQTIAAICGAGKVAGILVDRDNARRYVEQGVQFLYDHANSFLVTGAEDFARHLGRGGAKPIRVPDSA